jgi:hypothetical protein
MRKFKPFKPKVGELTVVSHSRDATMYRIMGVEGFNVGVIDAGVTSPQVTQWYDRGIFLVPTADQLQQFTEVQSKT